MNNSYQVIPCKLRADGSTEFFRLFASCAFVSFFTNNNSYRAVGIAVSSYSKKEAMSSSLCTIAISLEKSIVGLIINFLSSI